MPDNTQRVLLAVIERGGYPNFASLYQQAGYSVIIERSMRRALGVLRRTHPEVIVAEFNFQSDFRDRTSSLESLLAGVEHLPGTRVIVFYEKEYAHQLDKLRVRFPWVLALAFPIAPDELAACLRNGAGGTRAT